MTDIKQDCTSPSQAVVLEDITNSTSNKWHAVTKEILLRVGLLNYQPQHLAFLHLVTKFVQDECKKAGRRPSSLRTADLAALSTGFMEEYEQRMWPRELDRVIRGHLNNPNALDLPQNHTWSAHVRYTVEGRFPIELWKHREWQISHREMVTQKTLRASSPLAFLLQTLMDFARQFESSQTSLTQAELFERVLASRMYTIKSTSSEKENVQGEQVVVKPRLDSLEPRSPPMPATYHAFQSADCK